MRMLMRMRMLYGYCKFGAEPKIGYIDFKIGYIEFVLKSFENSILIQTE